MYCISRNHYLSVGRRINNTSQTGDLSHPLDEVRLGCHGIHTSMPLPDRSYNKKKVRKKNERKGEKSKRRKRRDRIP